MNKKLDLTLKSVVEEFNEIAMYEIKQEKEDFYIIKDLQCNEIIKTSKKEWYEKIKNYLIDELLTDKRTMEEFSYLEIANIYLQLDVLSKEIPNA